MTDDVQIWVERYQDQWDRADGLKEEVERLRGLAIEREGQLRYVQQAIQQARTIAQCPDGRGHGPHGHSPTTAFPGGVALCRGVVPHHRHAPNSEGVCDHCSEPVSGVSGVL